MESFKESGSIEYSADVLLALQPKDFDKNFKTNNKGYKVENNSFFLQEAISKEVRDLELKVLKNIY